MFSISQSASRTPCGAVTRRELLRVGGIGALGMGLPQILGSDAALAESAAGDERSCILVFLFGGASHIDTWDMKPDAPLEIRGEFRPIDTTVPGIQLCEHLPKLAQQAHQFTLIRSMHHDDRVHGSAAHEMYTGRPHRRPGTTDQESPDDWPFVGSMTMKYAQPLSSLPQAITLPRYSKFLDQPRRIAGQTGGLLGDNYNPFLIAEDPSAEGFHIDWLTLAEAMPSLRLSGRQRLVEQVDSLARRLENTGLTERKGALYRRAFAMLTAPTVRRAFEMSHEPEAVRDRYGRCTFGQSLLLARRLIEAGTRLVTVNWPVDTQDIKSPFWDTHTDNFPSLKNRLLPPLDTGLSALLEDLDQRGLMDRTMVAVTGEFGRTPKVGVVSQNAATDSTGRDHWPHAFTVLAAGGPVAGGRVYGSSTPDGGYVADQPVRPADLTATVLTHLGVDPQTIFHDPSGRPSRLCEGHPIAGLQS